MAGAANGAFCGAPLCRDPVFLDRLRDHAMILFGGALALGCLPPPLQYVCGPFLMAMTRFMASRVMQKSRPVVSERLKHTARMKTDPNYDWNPPDDALQWMIDECYACPDPGQLELGRVCDRLLISNDVSLLSTAFSAQNLILDLFSTDPALGYVDTLRRECSLAFRESGGKWTWDAISKLRLVDAAIRESLRLSPVGSVMLPRKVVKPDGIDVQGWSSPIPKGTHVAAPIEAIHLDADTYPNPREYNPFRFVHPPKGSTPGAARGSDPPRKIRSTVTLDENFLSFGIPGRHACPGRFFALLELKIFLAHLLLNYEVEHMASKPKPIYMLWARYPANSTIRIRKRRSDHP
ncbi:hypothetical protein HIM_06162 [Hirsutella minnesotensis 3608]|uniref:Cytochrome P450 n=1 Tax=Hirsutella minnesotensis 3608 TaxID=1043627 RepID=A0A0F7ZJN2_9HYPO|nr:hypothetical protein HIM_06162 [Hirsutella minnesotensis 3608]